MPPQTVYVRRDVTVQANTLVNPLAPEVFDELDPIAVQAKTISLLGTGSSL